MAFIVQRQLQEKQYRGHKKMLLVLHEEERQISKQFAKTKEQLLVEQTEI